MDFSALAARRAALWMSRTGTPLASGPALAAVLVVGMARAGGAAGLAVPLMAHPDTVAMAEIAAIHQIRLQCTDLPFASRAERALPVRAESVSGQRHLRT